MRCRCGEYKQVEVLPGSIAAFCMNLDTRTLAVVALSPDHDCSVLGQTNCSDTRILKAMMPDVFEEEFATYQSNELRYRTIDDVLTYWERLQERHPESARIKSLLEHRRAVRRAVARLRFRHDCLGCSQKPMICFYCAAKRLHKPGTEAPERALFWYWPVTKGGPGEVVNMIKSDPVSGDKLGRALGWHLKRMPGSDTIDLVAPVPSRGNYNKVIPISAAAASVLGVPHRTVLSIRKGRYAREQKNLCRKERERNVRGAFTADSLVRGLNVLVVDDIVTSGATLSEASRALFEVGAASVVCRTVFETQYISGFSL